MRKISPNVLFLGLVSFLTDLSSEMIIPVILPLYMKSVLGPHALAIIGVVEGVGDSAASLLRLVSGWLSDVVKKRKALVIIGYAVSTVVKPFFAFASLWWHLLFLRFGERAGKGIRTAPRDALLAASVTAENRGVSFGIQRAMDTAGAFCGLLTALLIVWHYRLTPDKFPPLFIVAFFPALLAVIALAVLVREQPPRSVPAETETPVRASPFNRTFILYVAIAGIFTLGNSSDAFLALRADQMGYSPAMIIGLLLVMNAVDAALATWFGALSDRIGRRNLLIASFGTYALVYFGFGFATHGWMLWPLFGVYGLYYAMSHGALRSVIADLVPDDARGRAYGLFHTVIGATALPASAIMGVLYAYAGFHVAFSFGGALALLAAILLLVFVPKHVNKEA
jgi:MFS family permease